MVMQQKLAFEKSHNKFRWVYTLRKCAALIYVGAKYRLFTFRNYSQITLLRTCLQVPSATNYSPILPAIRNCSVGKMVGY
jgi:hypothetical protein